MRTHLRKSSHVVTCVATPVDGTTHVDTYMSSCVEASCGDTCVSTYVSTSVPQLPHVCTHVWSDPQVWAHLWGHIHRFGHTCENKKKYSRFLFLLRFVSFFSSEQCAPFGSALRLGHQNSVQPPKACNTPECASIGCYSNRKYG